MDEDCDLIHSISIERPCADMGLWEAVYQTMKLGAVVFYFPGDVASLVADKAVVADLPPDMVEDLGEPVVISSAADIVVYIESA